jgi:hypothetical protein
VPSSFEYVPIAHLSEHSPTNTHHSHSRTPTTNRTRARPCHCRRARRARDRAHGGAASSRGETTSSAIDTRSLLGLGLVLAYSIRTTKKILETRLISSPFFFDPPELQVVRALNPAAADVSAPQFPRIRWCDRRSRRNGLQRTVCVTPSQRNLDRTRHRSWSARLRPRLNIHSVHTDLLLR